MPVLLSESGLLKGQPGLVFWTLVTAILLVFMPWRAWRRARQMMDALPSSIAPPQAPKDMRSEAEKRLAEHQAAVAAYRREAFGPLPKDAPPAAPHGRAVALKKT